MRKYKCPKCGFEWVDLSFFEITILNLLKNHKKLRPREISRLLDKSDPQVMHALLRLKKKGYITSEAGHGRTIYYLLVRRNDLS